MKIKDCRVGKFGNKEWINIVELQFQINNAVYLVGIPSIIRIIADINFLACLT